jgi:hypothetical protein
MSDSRLTSGSFVASGHQGSNDSNELRFRLTAFRRAQRLDLSPHSGDSEGSERVGDKPRGSLQPSYPGPEPHPPKTARPSAMPTSECAVGSSLEVSRVSWGWDMVVGQLWASFLLFLAPPSRSSGLNITNHSVDQETNIRRLGAPGSFSRELYRVAHLRTTRNFFSSAFNVEKHHCQLHQRGAVMRTFDKPAIYERFISVFAGQLFWKNVGPSPSTRTSLASSFSQFHRAIIPGVDFRRSPPGRRGLVITAKHTPMCATRTNIQTSTVSKCFPAASLSPSLAAADLMVASPVIHYNPRALDQTG